MWDSLKVSLQGAYRIRRQMLIWCLTALVMVGISFGLLHIAYHPGQVLEQVIHGVYQAWERLPGWQVFGLTYSPMSVLLATILFWGWITKKGAWIKIKHFCLRIWDSMMSVVSFSFITGFLAAIVFSMLYRDVKIHASLGQLTYDIFALQFAIYAFIYSIRKYTYPWMKARFDRYNIVLDAVEELRRGKNRTRNQRIVDAAHTVKEGGRQWQKQLSLPL